jgi:hypothetical protein
MPIRDLLDQGRPTALRAAAGAPAAAPSSCRGDAATASDCGRPVSRTERTVAEALHCVIHGRSGELARFDPAPMSEVAGRRRRVASSPGSVDPSPWKFPYSPGLSPRTVSARRSSGRSYPLIHHRPP